MPYCKTHTETVVAVVVAIVTVEVERTCIGIIIVASTIEERIIVASINAHKIRVRSGISPCFSLMLRSNEKHTCSNLLLFLYLFLFLVSSHYRFHITLLQNTHGNCCRCSCGQCCSRSRKNLHWYWDSCHHVWRTENRCFHQRRQNKSPLNAMM